MAEPYQVVSFVCVRVTHMHALPQFSFLINVSFMLLIDLSIVSGAITVLFHMPKAEQVVSRLFSSVSCLVLFGVSLSIILILLRLFYLVS